MKPALIGIYLGLTLSAILFLFFGVIVLSAHPAQWAGYWWASAMWLSGAWLVLIGIGRITRGYRAAIVCSVLVWLVLGLFVGYHLAAIIMVIGWISGDLSERSSAPAAIPLTDGQKAVLRAAGGLSVVVAFIAAAASFAHAQDPFKEALALQSQVPAEMLELDPRLKTDPAQIRCYLDHPEAYRWAVIDSAARDWRNYDQYAGKRPPGSRPTAAQWQQCETYSAAHYGTGSLTR